MSRSIVAQGRDAARKAAEILARAPVSETQGVALEPGSQWGRDRIVLSVDWSSVRFAKGSVLFKQDHEGFLITEFPPGSEPPKRASWLRGLSTYEMPLCMGLAGELAKKWPNIDSVYGYLERFACFYCNNRVQVESAARDLRFVAEGLLALPRWPAMFALVMEVMGEKAQTSLPHGMEAADLGAFLGRLINGSQTSGISLDRIPEQLRTMREQPARQAEERRQVPQYRRMMGNLERFAASVSPQIDHLRAAL